MSLPEPENPLSAFPPGQIVFSAPGLDVVIPPERPHEFFPFETIRPAQDKALNAWEKIIAKGKTYGCYELPTGAGKSPLAFAIGTWAEHLEVEKHQPGAYILTTQKSLQQQYLRDFASRGMVEMKGASNYWCDTHETDCGKGGLQNRLNKAFLQAMRDEGQTPSAEVLRERPTGCGACPYKEAKEIFCSTPLGVTNFSYLLAEANYGYSLEPRSLLIIDEAHNTESQLLSFVEIEITPGRAEMVGASKPPMIAPGDSKAAQEWILGSFKPAVTMKLRELELALREGGNDKLRSVYTAINNFVGRLAFIDGEKLSSEWFAHSDEKTGTLKLRPLSAREIAQKYLFRMGHKVLFMSATILDTRAFARGLGLDPAACGSLRVDSDFPTAHRPVFVMPSGSMSFKNYDSTLPKLLANIGKILDKNPVTKGIIHTHSYKLTKAVMDYLGETEHRARLVSHTADGLGMTRDEAIQYHLTSPEPTVLISPSMTEGLDLAEDLSRFQIMAKVPYPYLGDPFIKARMEHDPGWYQWQTALSLVQATGRSVRSREDKAATYLLDSDFERLLHMADSILPQWWKDAVHHPR